VEQTKLSEQVRQFLMFESVLFCESWSLAVWKWFDLTESKLRFVFLNLKNWQNNPIKKLKILQTNGQTERQDNRGTDRQAGHYTVKTDIQTGKTADDRPTERHTYQ
jgi:hypothetical protein